MLLTTTRSIEGHPIREYRGIISAETIIGANFVKDFFARITDVFGGRSGSYERVLREGKEAALAELTKEAQRLGANAVVGLKLDYEAVGASGSMLMVVASGTAVVI
ncbi:MAG: YbjQ family protein [Prevotellaceae bacterium]|nr:YbjQ family protein [Prevotellaceae bacterium]